VSDVSAADLDQTAAISPVLPNAPKSAKDGLLLEEDDCLESCCFESQP